MTAGKILCVCVKRVAGGRWQAVSVSQTRRFMKNKYNFTGEGSSGLDIAGPLWAFFSQSYLALHLH